MIPVTQLPIDNHASEIIEAVRHNPIVIVEGPAGTGKTTQLPRLLWQAGLIRKQLGVTQPRRIAAISIASHIAALQGCSLGDEVGYCIRFDDCTSTNTRIKIMTDGILLQEVRHDALLHAYDMIMVDEAHERSLNIDFVLGLLHNIVSARRDFRVIISSATLHPGKFQVFFKAIASNIPVISIANRTYPIHITYEPPTKGNDASIATAICEHVVRLHQQNIQGHILVFLPGESLIVQTTQLIAAQSLSNIVLLPLYGRLTRQEQERVFAQYPSTRKVILSTNLAETSLTIEGVHTVIDTGLAKVPWFEPKTGVTTLRQEPISRASATQRAGRAGRLGPGTVIRLYDEDSMQQRPEYTTEEILRIDISEAVLRLIDLGVHDIEHFAFLTAPPKSKLKAALQTLQDLRAIDANRRLTEIGKQMVPFPLSPALARMVVEAARHYIDAIGDVLLVGACLSVRSPFVFPPGEELAARRAHQKFEHYLGDTITALRACRMFNRAANPQRFCEEHFLDFDMMKFIQRAHQQLCSIAQQHGIHIQAAPANDEHVVRCLATGFADKLLRQAGYAYETQSGLKAFVHPSSVLFKNRPKWLVATELFAAGRTYAFGVNCIKPAWLADLLPKSSRAAKHSHKAGRAHENLPNSNQKATAALSETAPLPTFVSIGGVNLKVIAKRRPQLNIPLEAAAKLRDISVADLTPTEHRMRACLTYNNSRLMRALLPQMLERLRLLPSLIPLQQLDKLPLGMLLEADRNSYLLERFLPQLLQVVVPPATPTAGWLTLVSNNGGGFWYDVFSDFDDALATAMRALDDLEHSQQINNPALQNQIERLTTFKPTFRIAAKK